MHEFSLASEVMSIALNEAEKHNAIWVSEITIEVGSLSGVEADAFESALSLLAEGSIVEKSGIKILRINGMGFCDGCNAEFEMTQRMEFCPECNSFPSVIKGGNEFRLTSLVIEEQ